MLHEVDMAEKSPLDPNSSCKDQELSQRRASIFSLGEDHDPNNLLHDPEPLDEDLYGVGIASLLRDMRWISLGEHVALRTSRISATIFVLLATMCLQVFLVSEFKRLVTAKAVHSIRDLYDSYEVHMYGNWTWINENGKHRGIDGHFRPERFASLSSEKKSAICQIPMSQPLFLGAILAIWSFTVVIDIRKILFLIDLFLIKAPSDGVTLATMLAPTGEGFEMELQGLPFCMKVLLLFFIFVPRLIMDVILCWLGCRWLTATDSFTDVLLNAMALEFILLLKDLVYTASVPMRDKVETRTMLIPMRRKMRPSYCLFLGAFSWIFVVLIWVVVYLQRLQKVLPGYKWDVHSVCVDFIANETRE